MQGQQLGVFKFKGEGLARIAAAEACCNGLSTELPLSTSRHAPHHLRQACLMSCTVLSVSCPLCSGQAAARPRASTARSGRLHGGRARSLPPRPCTRGGGRGGATSAMQHAHTSSLEAFASYASGTVSISPGGPAARASPDLSSGPSSRVLRPLRIYVGDGGLRCPRAVEAGAHAEGPPPWQQLLERRGARGFGKQPCLHAASAVGRRCCHGG